MNCPEENAFQNILGIGENASNQHFLLFPQYLLHYQGEISPFGPCVNFRLLMLSIWTSLKLCRSTKGHSDPAAVR